MRLLLLRKVSLLEKEKNKKESDVRGDSEFSGSYTSAIEGGQLIEAKIKEKSETQTDDEVAEGEVNITEETQPFELKDNSEKNEENVRKSTLTEAGRKARKEVIRREQDYRRSWLTTLRKLQWSEQKLERLDEEESKGRVEATLLRMTLERVRKQAIAEQGRIEDARKDVGRWPNGAKILPSDEEWTPDPGQTRIVSPEDEKEEREWLGLLCQEVKDEIQLQGGVSKVRGLLGEINRDEIEEAFAIPREFRGCIYEKFYEKLELIQDTISLGFATASPQCGERSTKIDEEFNLEEGTSRADQNLHRRGTKISAEMINLLNQFGL